MSHSADYGRTWAEPERTVLPNNNSSVQAVKLASDAVVYNHAGGGDDPDQVVWPRARYPLTVALSEDGGQAWPFMRHIEMGDNFAGEQNRSLNRRCSYPSIVQTRDGLIHAAYSYRGWQCIKCVRLLQLSRPRPDPLPTDRGYVRSKGRWADGAVRTDALASPARLALCLRPERAPLYLAVESPDYA